MQHTHMNYVGVLHNIQPARQASLSFYMHYSAPLTAQHVMVCVGVIVLILDNIRLTNTTLSQSSSIPTPLLAMRISILNLLDLRPSTCCPNMQQNRGWHWPPVTSG